MEEIKATSSGNETMISISINNYKLHDTFNVTELKEEYFDQFIKLHSSLYQEVYLTGELLVQETSKFLKYVIISNDKILGFSIISNLGRDEEEIYYLYAECNDDKQQLVRYTLQESFKAASSVIILLETSEENDFPFYEKLGFKKKEVIITYTLNL